jgi:hypothetical protein
MEQKPLSSNLQKLNSDVHDKTGYMYISSSNWHKSLQNMTFDL